MDILFDTWTDSQPYDLVGTLDQASGWFIVKLRELKPQPVELGLLFGDYIHTLRSVLDHIAYALVANPSERIYFPVVREFKDWQSTHMNQIPGFPTTWLEQIEDVQPLSIREQISRAPALHAPSSRHPGEAPPTRPHWS